MCVMQWSVLVVIFMRTYVFREGQHHSKEEEMKLEVNLKHVEHRPIQPQSSDSKPACQLQETELIQLIPTAKHGNLDVSIEDE